MATAAIAGLAVAAPAAAQTRDFDVAAQPAAAGLQTLGRQADIQLISARRDTSGKRTNAVRGTMTAAQALERLLAGTGLRARLTGPRTYAIVPEGQAPITMGGIEGVDEDATTHDPIVVTGSRIAQKEAATPAPVTSLTAQELPSADSLTLGDALDRLPALRSTLNQNNSWVISVPGTAGVNGLDLRGLGLVRTLTLVNGRRHVSSIPGDTTVDINTIPMELLDRIDIVTGGNSAIYGSDAVAGVVNFVIKRKFEGLKANVRVGNTSRGDRGSYFAALTGGQNFAGGRGNVALSLEYAHTDVLRAEDRPGLTGYYDGYSGWALVDSTVGEPAAGDGIPDGGFFHGLRTVSSTGGTLTAVCGAADRANRARCTASGYAQYYMFRPDGSLVVNNPTVDFRDLNGGASNATIGGYGATEINNGNIASGQNRYSANLLAHLDVSDAFKPFIEAKYVHTTGSAATQPSFFSGSLIASLGGYAGDATPYDFRCNNPFLSAQNLSTMQAIGLCANVATGTFSMQRFNIDVGRRGESSRRDVYRIVAGVEGDFNGDWHYEVAANYGAFRGSAAFTDSLYIPNLFRALNAVTNASGQIVCAVNADADPGNDDPACAPLNLFGRGVASAAALDYVTETTSRRIRTDQFDVTAYVAGDLSQLFELPGGPVGFVLGGEYRRETAATAYSELGKQLLFFGVGGPDFDPPALGVKEVFGELSFPLFRDTRFAKQLTVSASGRMSHYDSAAGTVFAYNLGAIYAPIEDIRLRANYSQSVRAPTLANLYQPVRTAYQSVQDPCDVLYVNAGSATRAANCAAAGLPADFVNDLARRQPSPGISAGNPDLKVETARSLTLGAVLQPRVIPGLSLTVDYYDIKVDDLIAGVGAQDILSNCYDAATLDNAYCRLVKRQSDGRFSVPDGIRISPVNFAKQKTRGVDFELGYAHRFANGHRFSMKLLATYVMKLDNYTFVNEPDRPNRQLSELGDPQWAGLLMADYSIGPFRLGYQMQYVGKMTLGSYETQHAYAGLPALNADLYPVKWYPDVFYHNLSASYEVNDRFSLYGGVNNIADRQAPYSLTGQTPSAGSIYDIFGRSFYAGAKVRF